MNVGKLLANCTVQKNLPLYKALVKFTLYYYWRLSGGWVSCGFIGHFWAVCHLVCHEKCHCCILAKEKMLLWVPHTFLWYWILEFIWNSFLIVCWLYVLSETIDTSFQGQLTCHFHSLEGLIIRVGFCLWFFSILSFHNPGRRLFAGDQGHPLLINNIYLFSRHSCFLWFYRRFCLQIWFFWFCLWWFLLCMSLRWIQRHFFHLNL